MGRAITDAAAEDDRVEIVNFMNFDGGTPGVFVDFSAPAALQANLDRAVGAGRPIIVGTTGLSAEQHEAIDAAAARIAVLQAANTSLGVNLLAHLVREAAARLGDEWDIEIVEMHHRGKADAPSGTALLLGAAAAQGARRGTRLGQRSRPRRHRRPARARPYRLRVAERRIGRRRSPDRFRAEGERVELGHRAESRAIFAYGALRAALWLHGKQPGRYTMTDVLGLG
jgi:4-hydroxy-tetrahydrodipicolinate reductase